MAKVTAFVSAYNAERFIRGRIEDLLGQTLYQRGELEIVVVNAGSRDGTGYILRDYLGCITYINSLREPIYVSWNRALMMVHGEYVTNANADDRLRPDALEVLAHELDNHNAIDLVYADATVVSSENAVWGKPYTVSDKPPYFGRLTWPEFDPKLLIQLCYTGQSPMWRRELHARFGYFDDSYQLAGDYEFALRLAACGVHFKHIAQTLGLFYDDGAGINNAEFSSMEARRAILRWKGIINAR